MNTGLLILLVIPLLVLAEQRPPQNISDLAIWLQKWRTQEAEYLSTIGELVGNLIDTCSNNKTHQQNVLLQEDIEILKGRLAIAAIFSSVYMIISTLCLIGYLVVLVKKSVKKHQLKRHEEEVELMDQRLQERRERRRAAARAKSGSPRQQ